jgi:hypothetical protein
MSCNDLRRRSLTTHSNPIGNATQPIANGQAHSLRPPPDDRQAHQIHRQLDRLGGEPLGAVRTACFDTDPTTSEVLVMTTNQNQENDEFDLSAK